eukprot:jgi/Chrzof1/7084/Cz02g10080.t1
MAGATVTVASSGNATYTASNALTLAASNLAFTTGTAMTNTADSNIDFFINTAGSGKTGSFPVMSISSNVVKIDGNLQLTGSLDTISMSNLTISQVPMTIEDKLMQLATSRDSNATVDGTTTNSGAGVKISGNPDNVDSNLPTNMFEKSFTWQYGTNGTKDIGGDTLGTESYWELLGGPLAITKKKFDSSSSNIIDTTFFFRVGSNEELEIVKKHFNATTSNYDMTRVASYSKLKNDKTALLPLDQVHAKLLTKVYDQGTVGSSETVLVVSNDVLMLRTAESLSNNEVKTFVANDATWDLLILSGFTGTAAATPVAGYTRCFAVTDPTFKYHDYVYIASRRFMCGCALSDQCDE